jgi:hypothetical protein
VTESNCPSSSFHYNCDVLQQYNHVPTSCISGQYMSLEDTCHVLDNSTLVQMATCQFLTDCRYGRRNSMDSTLFVYLKCQILLITLSQLVHTWQADKWLVCGQSVSFGMSSSQVHESWERDPNDETNIWQLYPSRNICQIHDWREHRLRSWQWCQIQTLTSNLPITNLKSKSSFGFTLLILLKCTH